jgi:hypothetical protein
MSRAAMGGIDVSARWRRSCKRTPVVLNPLAIVLLSALSVTPEIAPADRARLLDVRGNFSNLRDSAGRVVYTPALPGAPPPVYEEWMRLLREAGSTHVFFGPPSGGEAYPGVDWENPDFWEDLPAFRRFIEKVIATPAADGRGFRPVLFVGDDTFAHSRFDRWDDLARALEGLRSHLIVLPAWEPVSGGWTSAQVSRALEALHAHFPESVIAFHGSPERVSGASHPTEADDPWRGVDADFYRAHGGQHISLAFYQAPHGREIYQGDCDEGPLHGATPAQARCWLHRFQAFVARAGAGEDGWRRLEGVVLFETVAYETFHPAPWLPGDGRQTLEVARRIATRAKRVCDTWQVRCGFGNGLPEDARP